MSADNKPTTTTNIYATPEDIHYAFPMVGNVITKAPGAFGGQPEMKAVVQTGMTLRDYFAGQALVGTMNEFSLSPEGISMRVQHSFEIADAMIAERSKVKS